MEVTELPSKGIPGVGERALEGIIIIINYQLPVHLSTQ